MIDEQYTIRWKSNEIEHRGLGNGYRTLEAAVDAGERETTRRLSMLKERGITLTFDIVVLRVAYTRS